MAADRALVLNVTDVPRNQFGLFVFAATPGSTPVGGGSQGVLCLGTPLIRLNGVVSDRGTGIASYAPDLADLPTIGAVRPRACTSSTGTATRTPRTSPRR